jgi:hypothetical protein
MSFTPSPFVSRTTTHMDIHDRAVRSAWIQRYGITEAQLRKAVWMVGSRISTLSSHLRTGSPS